MDEDRRCMELIGRSIGNLRELLGHLQRGPLQSSEVLNSLSRQEHSSNNIIHLTETVNIPSTRFLTTVMAFSNAFRVIISLGLISFSSSIRMASTARLHSSSFNGSAAGVEELYGNERPMDSMAIAIVLAV